jgi:hypothetical protein
MAIDLTKILNVIQEKVGSANSTNISTQDMINLADAAKKINAGHVIESYANTDVFPTASTSSKRIAFDELNRTLYLNNGSEWKQYDLTVPDAAAGASGASSHFPGSNYGYTTGGTDLTVNTINQFPFSSDANATDVGNLTVTRRVDAGQSSSDYGYSSGGRTRYNNTPPWLNVDIIDKFPFVSGGTATDVGNLTVAREKAAGQSSSEYGYTSGGYIYPGDYNIIEKFSFSTDGNSTDVGDLTVARSEVAGQTSSDNGYTSGGRQAGISPTLNTIDKFPFSSDASATDVGDITVARNGVAGQSSASYGYTSGGYTDPPWVNTIDKFPFSSDANATDVGDLTVARSSLAGQSSTDSGYSSGGANPAISATLNTIDKFPFSSDANATDVGDLAAATSRIAGQQY